MEEKNLKEKLEKLEEQKNRLQAELRRLKRISNNLCFDSF